MDENNISSLGLDFSIESITVNDETNGDYQMGFRITYVDDNAFANGEEISSIGIKICGKGMNGKLSCTEADISIVKNGGSGSESTGTIEISPNSLTMATEDGVQFNVIYDNIQPTTLKIQSIVTSFSDIENNIRIDNESSTSGTANLNFYQPGISAYRGNVYDVYLTGKDINGVWTMSNTVQLDID